jgi:hypothetical protein
MGQRWYASASVSVDRPFVLPGHDRRLRERRYAAAADVAAHCSLSLMRPLALVLTTLWAATALAVAAAYRPGGPLDLVVIVLSFAPVAVAVVGVRWPVEARSHRDRVGLVWLWLGALLLGIPVLYGVASSLIGSGPQSLVPSVEAAYAGGLALLAMAGWSVLGFVHGRLRRRAFAREPSLIAGGLAIVVTAAIGALFALIVLINEATLVPDATSSSRFGPVSADIEPPDCDVPPSLGANAAVSIAARSSLDDEPRGEAHLSGSRRGRDEAWRGEWSGPEGSGELSYLRLGTQAWLRGTGVVPDEGESAWRIARPDPFGLTGTAGLTMDGPPFAIVDVPRGRIVAEDLGLELVEGATARHCRSFIDGPTAVDTFLPLRWLLDDDEQDVHEQVGRWRGEMDWWVFGDGELGRARVEVSGSRADTTWQDTGVRATLQAELEAVDRDRRPEIAAPAAAPGGPLATSATALESAAP